MQTQLRCPAALLLGCLLLINQLGTSSCSDQDGHTLEPESDLPPEARQGFEYANLAAQEYFAAEALGSRQARKLQQQTNLGGFVFVSTDDADDTGHCQGNGCGSLYANVLRQGYNLSRVTTANKILTIGINPVTPAVNNLANASFQSWRASAGLGSVQVDYAISDADIRNIPFANYKLIYIPSAWYDNATRPSNTRGGILNYQNTALISRMADFKTFVGNLGGSLIVLTQAGLRQPYGFFPLPLVYVNADFEDVTVTDDMKTISPASTSSNLDHNAWHGYFTGPKDWAGIYRVIMSVAKAPLWLLL